MSKDLYEDLKKYTFPALLRDALNAVPNDIDKREGSILHDALAPLSMTLAKSFGVLHQIALQSRFQTATGDYLDLCGSQFGIYRGQATHAKWKASLTPFPIAIPIGHRFVSSEGLGLEYEALAVNSDGTCTLMCTTPGKAAGGDFGALHPMPPIAGLKAVQLSQCIDQGADSQSDDDYRIKIWQGLQRTGYGGNYDDYKKWIFESFRDHDPSAAAVITGFQIYPAWDGGGTVQLTVTADGLYEDGSVEHFAQASNEAADALKQFLDPISLEGYGAGIVPMGHRVSVNTPVRYGMGLHAVVTCKAGFQVDAPMQGAILNAVKKHLANARKEALSTESSPYPTDGYIAKIIVNSLRSDIIYADRGRIEDVQLFKRNMTNGNFDEEQEDKAIVSTARSSSLPYLDVLKINDITVYERG